MTFTSRPELLGTFGMVASTHWLASASGMAVLEAGGNAYDAAVATGLVLHVVEPHLNGIAGEVPVIAHDARTGRSFVVCGQGVAPQAATISAFGDLGVAEIPGAGLLAATVPGSWGAWLHLLSGYGTLTLRDVARFAIGYARDGYPMLPTAAATIRTLEPTFRDHWHGSAATYLADGVPAPGTRFRNPALADTLERLVAEGEAAGGDREAQIEASRRAFYSGFVAEAIEAFARTAVWDGGAEPHAGFLIAADLDAWSATEEEPAAAEVAGHRVLKTAAWGQGPMFLQQLQMLEALGADRLEAGSADLIHTVVEVAKLAFADREAWFGDSTSDGGVLPDLLEPAYAVARAGLVGNRADATLRPGSPGGRTPTLPAAVVRAMSDGGAWPDGLATPGQGEPTVPRGDTTHLDVVDRWGNVVSATPSGAWLQSSPTIPELGFALGTRAQMFWLEEGLPASLVPGRRPRTTLSPGMVLGDDGSVLAFGTPGGDQQDQWPVPFLLRALAGGEDLQQAIDAPSWHTTHAPSSFAPRVAEPLGVRVEERVGEDVVAELRRRGHDVTVTGPWLLGRISAAGIRADGMVRAGANPRGMQGYAVGR